MNIFEVKKWLDENLSHNDHIKESDIDKWYETMVSQGDHEIIWHLERLKGIGGSEIGSIIKAHLGIAVNNKHYLSPIKSATQIAKEKFLMTSSIRQNAPMVIGSYLEPYADRMYLEMLRGEGHKVEIVNAAAITKRPSTIKWLVGNPDRVLKIDGKLVVVDYKVMVGSHDHVVNKVPEQYAWQLKHYRLCLQQNYGLKVDKMILVPMVVNKKMNFELLPNEVFTDEQQTKLLIAAGNRFWMDVEQGIVPEPQEKKETPVNDLSAQINDKSYDYTIYQTIGNLARRQADKIKATIADTLYLQGTGNYEANNLLKIESADSINYQEVLERTNLKKDDYISYGDGIDPKLAVEVVKKHNLAKECRPVIYDKPKIDKALADKNIDISEHLVPTVKFMIIRDKSSPIINEFNEKAQKNLNLLYEQMLEARPEVIEVPDTSAKKPPTKDSAKPKAKKDNNNKISDSEDEIDLSTLSY